ncbi:MAG: flagellar protein FlbB [Alphaproteobacteria bacterium]|nr:flagellar protein FlbB [Alphaproteobacteria bacterium]
MKKFNIFTFLMMVAVFAFALRLIDFSGFSTPASVAENAAPPKEFSGVTEPAPPPADKSEDEAAKKEAAPAAPPAPPSYGERGFSGAELDVLQSLAKRRDELDQREQQIVQHEALLKAAEGEVDRKIAELNKIKSELESLLNKQQSIQDERIDSLVKIYEGMKPKEAARIFDTLEMDILVSVISKMSERKSSPILANMDPEKARLVTIKLSEQHKLPNQPAAGKKESAPSSAPPSAPPLTINQAPPPATP